MSKLTDIGVRIHLGYSLIRWEKEYIKSAYKYDNLGLRIGGYTPEFPNCWWVIECSVKKNR